MSALTIPNVTSLDRSCYVEAEAFARHRDKKIGGSGQLLPDELKHIVFLKTDEANALVGSRHANTVVRVNAAEFDAIARDKPISHDTKGPDGARRAYNRPDVQRVGANSGYDDAIEVLRDDRAAC